MIEACHDAPVWVICGRMGDIVLKLDDGAVQPSIVHVYSPPYLGVRPVDPNWVKVIHERKFPVIDGA